jgi:hypothetical protein
VKERVYEALLSQGDSLALIRLVQRSIEKAGGRVKIAPPTATGMVLVTLILPEPLSPQQFLPSLPFYPV